MFPSLKRLLYADFRKRFVTKIGIHIRNFGFATGDILRPNQLSGIYYIKDPRLHKGTAFDLEERQHLTIQGLLPPRVRDADTQATLAFYQLRHYKNPLDQYMYLQDLRERNTRLYFRLLNTYISELIPIIYTPTVGLVCQNYGRIFRTSNGLFITCMDKGNIKHILANWPEAQVKAVCITDGERILGLGDLGCNGMGIVVGKLALYTALAGIEPHSCLPIMLDVGTNNEELRKDPFYMGLRMPRITGQEYDDFLDEFMEAVTEQYGSHVLVHFEDFAFVNAWRLMNKYRNKYCIFNDDIQGTGAIGVAGIFSAAITLGRKVSDLKFLFVGAGGANTGICTLLVQVLKDEGLTDEEAYKNIYLIDHISVLTTDREYSNETVKLFAKDVKPHKELINAVKDLQPNVLIGATAQPGLFTPQVLKAMAEINERPVIFALSNPTSRAECTAEQAIAHTDGRAIYCSGSPMPPVQYKDNCIVTSQMNNAYIYPGVALGVISSQAYYVTDDMFIIAAKEMVNSVTEEQRNQGLIFPSIEQVNEVSLQIAKRISEYVYHCDISAIYPVPKDIEAFIKKNLYSFTYTKVFPPKWTWKELPDVTPNPNTMNLQF